MDWINYVVKWADALPRSGGDRAYNIVMDAETSPCALAQGLAPEMNSGLVAAKAAVGAHQAIGSM